MTYSPLVHTRVHVGQATGRVAVATTIVALALDAFGVWGDGSPYAEPAASDFLVPAGLTLVAAAVVFGIVVPRTQHRRAAGLVALVMGAGSLALVPLFWLGVGGILGVGAVVLGVESSHAQRDGVLARAGVVLGTVATVAYVLMYALDWMNTNNVL